MSDEPTLKNVADVFVPDAEQADGFASAIGAFKDDPVLDAMMANIRERRREIDADDTIG